MVAKDNSKYLFNSERYGKGRLVLAVVSAYINKHQPTIKELRETFSRDLQGSIPICNREKLTSGIASNISTITKIKELK